ncbi:MAG: hypothetical protein GX558_00975, partial [Clostridiales bacterium]|nr:hypothetical protein [Clostridiales bacterium]
PIESDTSREGAVRTITHRAQTPSGRVLTATDRIYDGVHTTWHTEHWCKTPDDVDAYLSIPFVPVEYDASGYAAMRAETGDHGIIMASVGDPACTAMEIMEFGEATVWALSEPDHYKETMDELHRRNMINLENLLAAGPVDLYRICGPEYLTPPYLPPRYFERFVAPYVADMVALIHRHGSLARIHSHGRIGRVLDMIRSCGADALDPIEGPPDGDIELAEVKERIGDTMCLFGNLQLKLLENGAEREVREAVRRAMDAAKGDTGYVIMPTASPINVPLNPNTERNYKVFIETALELGRYD